MGDFLLDFRPQVQRQVTRAADFFKFFPDMHVTVIEEAEFSLVLSSADDQQLWGPCRSADGNLVVGLCGRLALKRKDWDEAGRGDAVGGLACRHILRLYREGGIAAITELSGNFVVFILDRSARKFFLITDRWGIAPAFSWEKNDQPVFSSHPDALAVAVGETGNLDMTSLAEFILTCRLSYPFTYYRRIRALPFASVINVDLGVKTAPVVSERAYFDLRFNPPSAVKEEELADEFAAAVRSAVAKRSLPKLGRTAVALSGGLDSRTVLCAASRHDGLVSFCCHDEENAEFQIARRIASTLGVEFVPFRRDFDYYANNAALGVKISAGMGCIASNHFLGFRDELRRMEVANLLTGCYCDYVFKGLALNKRVNRWTTVESLGPFDFSFYARHFTADTEAGRAVRQRLETLFPDNLRQYDTEERIAGVERRRMFPLCYEEDNAQRTIPQRVMGWSVPIADNALIAVYLQMSISAKLNGHMFKKMVARVCSKEICQIPDANTGTPLNAGPARVAVNSHLRRLKNKVAKLRKSIATTESWPNWKYYLAHSQKLRELWSRPNPEASDIFRQVLGRERYHANLEDYGDKDLWLAVQLFTLKLWFDQRA